MTLGLSCLRGPCCWHVVSPVHTGGMHLSGDFQMHKPVSMCEPRLTEGLERHRSLEAAIAPRPDWTP